MVTVKHIVFTSGLLLFLTAMGASAQTWEGTVVGAPAGDILAVDREGESVRVRVFGVDCPDTGQSFAEEATAFTKKHTVGKKVGIEVVATDSTGMRVAKITLPEGADLGEALLEKGLAWWDRRNAEEARSLKLLNAEALIEEKGLFAQDAPLAPWDFRASTEAEDFQYTRGRNAMEDAAALAEAEEKAEADGEEEEEEEEVKTVKAQGDPNKQYVFDPGNAGQPIEDINPTQLLTQHAPKVATDAQGEPIGITADNISQIPYASMLGLQDDDVITQVNGVDINSMDQIPRLVEQFRDTKQFNVRVMRNGEPQTLNIQVP
ncbi:MAG: thermonuclease family protein [Candidatus Hydrogenedentota bacterium]